MLDPSALCRCERFEVFVRADPLQFFYLFGVVIVLTKKRFQPLRYLVVCMKQKTELAVEVLRVCHLARRVLVQNPLTLLRLVTILG